MLFICMICNANCFLGLPFCAAYPLSVVLHWHFTSSIHIILASLGFFVWAKIVSYLHVLGAHFLSHEVPSTQYLP